MKSFIFFLCLMMPGLARAADAFCTDPARVICGQKKIESDLGTTFVGSNVEGIKLETSRLAKLHVTQQVSSQFQKEIPDKEILQLARLLNLGMGPCTFGANGGCRTAVLNAAVSFANTRTSLGFSDSLVAQPPRLPLGSIDQLTSDQVIVKLEGALEDEEEKLSLKSKSEDLAWSIFNDLKTLYLAKLQQWPIPVPEKAKMIARLKKLRFIGASQCGESTALYEVDSNNDPQENSVSICNGVYLRTNSPAALATIIGHEISHTFGPCVAAAHGVSSDIQKPFGALVSCLESKGSRAPGTPAPAVSCMGSDQIDELFGDWSAAEVVPGYLEGKYPTKSPMDERRRFESARAYLCGSAYDPNDSHPSANDRINNIEYQNPKIRTLSSCTQPAKSNYCSFDHYVPAPAIGFPSSSKTSSRRAQ